MENGWSCGTRMLWFHLTCRAWMYLRRRRPSKRLKLVSGRKTKWIIPNLTNMSNALIHHKFEIENFQFYHGTPTYFKKWLVNRTIDWCCWNRFETTKCQIVRCHDNIEITWHCQLWFNHNVILVKFPGKQKLSFSAAIYWWWTENKWCSMECENFVIGYQSVKWILEK